MFTAEQYRAKATEYSKLARTANGPNELREFQALERSFAELANNAQWLTENRDKRTPCAEYLPAARGRRMNHVPSALAHLSCAVLSAGLILAFSSNPASSAENCQRLEALANQYAGVG